jgi:hypothetical protein
MKQMLEATLQEHLRHKIKIVVFDVSGEITPD